MRSAAHVARREPPAASHKGRRRQKLCAFRARHPLSSRGEFSKPGRTCVAEGMERAARALLSRPDLSGHPGAGEGGERHPCIAGRVRDLSEGIGPAEAADDKAGGESLYRPQRQRRPQDFALLDIKWIRDNQDAFVTGLEAGLRAGAA